MPTQAKTHRKAPKQSTVLTPFLPSLTSLTPVEHVCLAENDKGLSSRCDPCSAYSDVSFVKIHAIGRHNSIRIPGIPKEHPPGSLAAPHKPPTKVIDLHAQHMNATWADPSYLEHHGVRPPHWIWVGSYRNFLISLLHLRSACWLCKSGDCHGPKKTDCQ